LATRNVLLSNEQTLIPKISDFVSERHWKIEEEKETLENRRRKREMEHLFLKRVWCMFFFLYQGMSRVNMDDDANKTQSKFSRILKNGLY
jgi:hypothetical protein